MKKRNRILLIGLLAIVLGGVAWAALRPHEPVYQGKRLSQWLDEYNRAETWEKTEPASKAMRAMGTNCLPFLLSHLKQTKSPIKRKFFDLVAKQHWIKFPFYGEDPYYSTSILALRALGSNAAPLCPELLNTAEDDGGWVLTAGWNMAEDDGGFGSGMTSLLAIGPGSIPTLTKACQSTNVEVRTLAALLIAKLTTRSSWFAWGWHNARVNGRPLFDIWITTSDEDVPNLISLLENPNTAIRRASADAIGRVTMQPYALSTGAAMKPLTKSLNDPDSEVRLTAAKALKTIEAPRPQPRRK